MNTDSFVLIKRKHSKSHLLSAYNNVFFFFFYMELLLSFTACPSIKITGNYTLSKSNKCSDCVRYQQKSVIPTNAPLCSILFFVYGCYSSSSVMLVLNEILHTNVAYDVKSI